MLDSQSVLMVTLDSCRYDTFAAAEAPAMKSVGGLYRADAPSHFTLGSHTAFFAGFTPGIATVREPQLNPKWAKVFRLGDPGSPDRGESGFVLRGRTIVKGFGSLGYLTLGSGAVRWFDPATPTSRSLIDDFDDFFYPGNSWCLARQLAWIDDRLATRPAGPVFVFLNVGETHVPYYFEGAPWSADDNPCVPFQAVDRASECRQRQRACVEFIDRAIAPLLRRFMHATILICGDHGDCWGEDGLWEHGISHPMTLSVPLIIRLRGRGIGVPGSSHAGPEAAGSS